MKHAELVQSATDLLAESPYAEHWLAKYDQALGSANDQLLVEFVNELGCDSHIAVKLAA
jgi:hypothetical protein